MNFVIRDPELIALLIRGVPHGQLTKTLQRLMREGYDRMVAAGVIHPADYLTPSELALLQSGHRNAVKRRAAETPDSVNDTTVIPSPQPVARANKPGSMSGLNGDGVPGNLERGSTPVPPAPAPAPVGPRPPLINDDDANVLLGNAG